MTLTQSQLVLFVLLKTKINNTDLPGFRMLSALSANTLDFSPTDGPISGVTGRLFKIPFTGVLLNLIIIVKK